MLVQPSKDNYLTENLPGSNWGSYTALMIDCDASGRMRIPIGFTIPSLPAGAILTSAIFSLYYAEWALHDPVNRNLYANRLTRNDWTESGSSWNSYKANASWTTPGGDYTVVDQASTIFPGSYGWMNWNVLALVQDAIANRGNLLDLFITSDESYPNYQATFYSKECGTPSLYPKVLLGLLTLVEPPLVAIDNEALQYISLRGDINIFVPRVKLGTWIQKWDE